MDNVEVEGVVKSNNGIVRLKEIINKWHSNVNNIPLSVSRHLRSSSIIRDSDDEGFESPSAPPDVPKGFLAVYVGEEIMSPLRRFIIPTVYLSHHLFKLLLEKAEEEYGFDHGAGLTIPCQVETFKYLLNCIETENESSQGRTPT